MSLSRLALVDSEGNRLVVEQGPEASPKVIEYENFDFISAVIDQLKAAGEKDPDSEHYRSYDVLKDMIGLYLTGDGKVILTKSMKKVLVRKITWVLSYVSVGYARDTIAKGRHLSFTTNIRGVTGWVDVPDFHVTSVTPLSDFEGK